MTAEHNFTGRVAIVTGGARGLGRSYALELARRGADVVINDPGTDIHGDGTSPAALRAVQEIESLGGRAVASVEAVTTPDTAESVVAVALEHFGRCDIVINSAGVIRDRTFAKMTKDEFDAVLASHLLGPFFLTQAAFRRMAAQQYGRIIFTGSAAGLFGNIGAANYALAKMGVVGLTKVVALEGARYGILANTVAPLAATRMAKDGLKDGLPEQMSPDMVCPLVLHLVSDKSSHTGRVFSAGGGHFSEVFVAETGGWNCKDNPSVETVAANFEHIASREQTLEFESAFAEIAHVCDQLQLESRYGH